MSDVNNRHALLSEVRATLSAYKLQVEMMDANGMSIDVENWKRDYVKHITFLFTLIMEMSKDNSSRNETTKEGEVKR